jgi:hypothetical protein
LFCCSMLRPLCFLCARQPRDRVAAELHACGLGGRVCGWADQRKSRAAEVDRQTLPPACTQPNTLCPPPPPTHTQPPHTHTHRWPSCATISGRCPRRTPTRWRSCKRSCRRCGTS